MVEDITNPSTCEASTSLLKEEGAPFLFVKDWEDLPSTLSNLNGNLLSEQRCVPVPQAGIHIYQGSSCEVVHQIQSAHASTLLECAAPQFPFFATLSGKIVLFPI